MTDPQTDRQIGPLDLGQLPAIVPPLQARPSRLARHEFGRRTAKQGERLAKPGRIIRFDTAFYGILSRRERMRLPLVVTIP